MDWQSVQAQDTNQSTLSIDMRLQCKCKHVTSGLDYNVSQVFLSSCAHKGPLANRERTTRWRKESPKAKQITHDFIVLLIVDMMSS